MSRRPGNVTGLQYWENFTHKVQVIVEVAAVVVAVLQSSLASPLISKYNSSEAGHLASQVHVLLPLKRQGLTNEAGVASKTCLFYQKVKV